jgi:DNA-3-methyladenine glycosylase
LKLDYQFYQRDAVTVAKELLGKFLVREIDDEKIIVKIVDTEAYQGAEDKASHAHNNKKTKRTKTMFARGGLAYIYLIYGMYYCFNIVTAAEENPHAVLIRAVEPVSGLELIKSFKTMQDNYIFCSI